MTDLRAFLFQNFEVVAGEKRSLDLGSPTNRSLFAYLLLHRQRPADRRRLAFEFWPRETETAARRNLRQYLHRIKRALESVDPQGTFLVTNGTTIQVNPQIPIWIDVEAFRFASRPEADLAQLQQAVSLYRGDLLDDIYDDWPIEERLTLRLLYLGALDRLSQMLTEIGDLEQAVSITQKWVVAEPLDEAAHRRMIALHAMKGDRHLAIQHYQMLTQTLEQELGSEPLPETQALYYSVQSGVLQQNEGRRLDFQDLRTSPQSSPPIMNIPMVGRQEEFDFIQERLEEARQGFGSFLLITGESGIGKTRLIQEHLTHHADLPTLHVICHELEAMMPYAPMRQLLRQAIRLLPDDTLDPANPRLAALSQLEGTLMERSTEFSHRTRPGGESMVLSEAMKNLVLELLSVLALGPLHLVIDDLHWSDSATWNILTQLANHAIKQPLLVIGLCRLEDLPAERGRLLRSLERNSLAHTITLKRLSAQETSQLASQLLPEREITAIFLSRLYKETEGNPFFIVEMARAMKETSLEGTLSKEGMGHHFTQGIPLSIQNVIEARLDRLSPKSRDLLSSAAAIGSSFDYAFLQKISQAEPEEIIYCIEEWLQRGLIHEDSSGYYFSHEKIRQVSYANLSGARRQYIHGCIAEALEVVVPPVGSTSLAHHYARSDQPLKALPFLTKAGEQALQARSYLEVRQFGLQALGMLRHTPGPDQRVERVDLNLQLAQAYAFSGDLPQAQEILGETEHLAMRLEDNRRLAQVLRRSAQISWLRGQPAVAGDYARRTLRLAEEIEDHVLLSASLRMLGRVSIALSAFDVAIAYLLRYIKLSKSKPQPPDLPIVLGYLGVAYARVGSWNRALETAQSGVDLAEGLVRGKSVLGEQNFSQTFAFARMQLAFIYADLLEWDTCLKVLEPVPDLLKDSSLMAGGEPSQRTEQTLDGEIILTPLDFMLLSIRGMAFAHLGREERGINYLRTGLDWADENDYRVFHYLPRIFLARAWLLAGDIGEANLAIEQALDQARLAGNRWAVGIGLREAGEIHWRMPVPNWPLIENYLIESMQLLRQVRARPDLARTYLNLRRLYDRAGQIAWAVDCHFRAISIFEELGMTKELNQAQGQAAGHRRGAVVFPDLPLRGPNQPIEG